MEHWCECTADVTSFMLDHDDGTTVWEEYSGCDVIHAGPRGSDAWVSVNSAFMLVNENRTRNVSEKRIWRHIHPWFRHMRVYRRYDVIHHETVWIYSYYGWQNIFVRLTGCDLNHREYFVDKAIGTKFMINLISLNKMGILYFSLSQKHGICFKLSIKSCNYFVLYHEKNTSTICFVKSKKIL